MATFCIPRIQAEMLRKAAKQGDIAMEKLQHMTSQERRNLFSKYLGEADGKSVNALFEKALVSRQKVALKNWVWKNMYGGKPLYTELTVAQSKAMRDAGLSVKDLRRMSPTERIKELSKYVSRAVAERLNKRFEDLKKSGNLAMWEERVLGTKVLHEDKKLKGAFARIEALDDLGLLTPKQTGTFMEDLVSMKLGVSMTAEEAAKLSKLSKKVSQSFDEVGDDWTFTNEESVRNYFRNRKELEVFVDSMNPSSALSMFTEIGARGALLFSLRSLTNSFLFQIIPGITRAFVKRIAASSQIPGDYTKLARIQTSMMGSGFTKAHREFVTKQAKMGIKIYRETGYDISRMQNLDDGFYFFGEKFSHVNGPTLKEAQGIKETLRAGVRAHAKLMEGGLKYAAGGTDAVFANIHRADTTALVARVTARNEAKAGVLPKGMSEADRALQLMKEASSFRATSPQAQYIREMGILDAHYANGTQNEIYGKIAVGVRDRFKFGDFHLGKTVVPFLKIPANMLGTGLEATGPGLIMGTQQMIKGITMAEKGAVRSTEVAKGLSKVLASGGLLGGALFFTSLLSPEDYIGPYDWRKRSENKLTQEKNAGHGYFRLGGKWYNSRWLGPMAIPFHAIMQSRQHKARGDDALVGYLAGILHGLITFPGIKELKDVWVKFDMAAGKNSKTDMASALGFDPESMTKWWASRLLPSFVIYDVWGLRDNTRYTSQGRPLPQRGDSVQSAVAGMFFGANIKEDMSNAITREMDKLLYAGHLPVLTEPVGARVDAAIEKYGEEGYENRLNRLKRDYANEVLILIRSHRYQRLSPEERKKAIDKIRQKEILDRI